MEIGEDFQQQILPLVRLTFVTTGVGAGNAKLGMATVIYRNKVRNCELLETISAQPRQRWFRSFLQLRVMAMFALAVTLVCFGYGYKISQYNPSVNLRPVVTKLWVKQKSPVPPKASRQKTRPPQLAATDCIHEPARAISRRALARTVEAPEPTLAAASRHFLPPLRSPPQNNSAV